MKYPKINYKTSILRNLKEIIIEMPKQPLAFHIGIATQDYPSIDQLTDKEFNNLLEIYLQQQAIEDFSEELFNDEDYTGTEEEF